MGSVTERAVWFLIASGKFVQLFLLGIESNWEVYNRRGRIKMFRMIAFLGGEQVQIFGI